MKKRILLSLLFLLLFFGCDNPEPNNKFKEGDIVTHKVSELSGIILYGQVIFIYYHYSIYRYDVRWVINSIKTNTHLLSEDESLINTYFLIEKMKEYELKKVDNEEDRQD